MNDYTELDTALIAKIAGGVKTFDVLRAGPLGRMADEMAGRDRWGSLRGWRLIDRRLQALRKAGRLTYDRKTGWRTE